MAEEWLGQIQTLTGCVRHHEQLGEQRLEQIRGLTSHIRRQEVAAAEGLQEITRLNAVIQQLENTLSDAAEWAERRARDRIALSDSLAQDRSAEIEKLTAYVRTVEAELQKVQKVSADLQIEIDQVRASVSYVSVLCRWQK